MRLLYGFVKDAGSLQPYQFDFEVEDDDGEEEIQEALREAALDYVEWWWKEDADHVLQDDAHARTVGH